MDIKDVAKPVSVNEKLTSETTASFTKRPRSAQEDAAVKIDTKEKVERATKIREAANEVITVVNVVSDATTEIDRLVRSISGIVDQATRTDIPEKRLVALQSEANQLVDAIKRQVATAATGPVNPLTGDPIRLDADLEIGKKVEVKLPTEVKDAFGLGTIDFSKSDAIAQSKSNVEKAQQHLDSLKKVVGETKQTVFATVNELDVALQNSEASTSTVRDLDEALKLANTTKTGITLDPKGALGSIQSLSSRSLSLLE